MSYPRLFEAMLDIIKETSPHPVSEADYHELVWCIRAVKSKRIKDAFDADDKLSEYEYSALQSRGWEKYNPFTRPENIRFGIVFGLANNGEVGRKISVFHVLNEDGKLNK